MNIFSYILDLLEIIKILEKIKNIFKYKILKEPRNPH